MVYVEIPETILSIGDYAFCGCSSIDGLIIGSGVTNIGIEAFHNCSNLGCLIIPNGVTTIGSHAFFGCARLDSIFFGSGVDSVANNAFDSCTGVKYISHNNNKIPMDFRNGYGLLPSYDSLHTLVIGDSVTAIPRCCLLGHTKLNSVHIGSNVTSIGDSAFLGCSSINNLYIGSSVQFIGNQSFHGCNNIRKLVIPNSVTSIGNNAFYGCNKIDSLYIGSGLQSVGIGAFSGCTGLKYMFYNARDCSNALFASNTNSPFTNTITSQLRTLIIGDSCEIIPNYNFYNRSSLDSLFIGSGVQSVGIGAFSGCTGLKYMYYNARNCSNALFGASSSVPFYNTNTTLFSTLVIGDSVEAIPNNAFYNRQSISNVSMGSGVQSIGNSAFRGCNSIGLLNIPDGVTHIGDSAFYGCSGIDSVHISNGIDTIGNYVFSGCSGIIQLIIPDSVTYIGNGAFSGCSNIQRLNIHDRITHIGSNAFYGCSSIDSLFIGSGVQSIGTKSFAGCTGLKYMFYNAGNCNNALFETSAEAPFYNTSTLLFNTLVIGDSVEILPNNAFLNRASLQNVFFPEGLTSIGNGAFRGCSGIGQLIIPDGVTHIGDNAFYGCSGADSLHISSGIVAIGDNTFRGCSGISQIDIPSNVTSIGANAFYGCSGIQSLTIPESVINIGSGAFSGCYGIDSLAIGSGIESIGSSVFYGCRGIHRLTIPDNVTSIGSNAFYGCSGIDSLHIGNGVATIGNNAFQGCSSIHRLVVPDNVTSIGDNAFNGCSGVDSLFIGNGVSSIGAKAFLGCTGIKYMYYNAGRYNSALFGSGNTSPFYNTSTTLFNRLDVGDSVRAIPENAFMNRTGLQSVLFSNSVTSIGNNAFRGCSGIVQLVIPDGITHLGDYAFFGCSGIDSLHISNGIDTISSNTFSGCSGISRLTIPNGVVVIGDNAFYGCAGIETLSLGEDVMTIGNNAFQNCSGFSKLTIPESVTSIGGNAFYGCTSIDSLYIGSGVQTIGSGAFSGCTGLRWLNYNAQNVPVRAFYGCTQLTTLIFGSSVQNIGAEAFMDCDNLLTANIKASHIGRRAFADCDRLLLVTLDNSVQTLSNGVFGGCFRLQNIDLGSVTTIDDSVFDGCVRLENPELPDGLTTIGTRAFNGCSLLAGKLTFPATMSNIGDSAYNGIGTITEIEMLGATPPTIYANTFASVSNTTPVSVPCGAVINYYTTDYWENFSTIMESAPYKLTVTSNNEEMGSVAITQHPTCTNYSAIIQATANTAYHFIQWSDGNGTNPRTIQMTQDSTLTAIFVPNNSYIVVEPNDPTMGTTSGTGTYGYNAPVTMTAMAYDGYHFLKWNDGNTQNPRYMAAVRDTTFIAIFVSNVSTITVYNANPEWGNVGGSGVYYYQNLVSLTATPNYGYHFSQWNDGNTQNPRTIIINQDSTFTAYFAVNTYSIVAISNSTAMGSVTGGGTYTYLHEMSLTATPAYGYHFVQWNDQNTDNPRTITVTRDSAFTAQFAANSYTITAEPNDPTMGSAYGSGTYNYNTSVTLTAVETYGYHFTQWSDGVTDNPRTITVQNSATYTAQFEINSYIITVQSSNPAIGTTSGGGSYNYLTPVNITAIPNAGYHFTQWSDGNTDNPRLVTVTQNATYTAQFAINSYAVGVASSNSNMGSVSGSGTYNHNSTATLTATAYYGYHFVQWQDGNTENPRSVVVTDSAQYTAQFDYNSYLITANSSNITLGSAIGGGSYNYLSQVALTAVPAPHYHFTMWNDSIEDNPRTITVTRDSVFTAHFVIDTHTVTVVSADNTMGTASGSSRVAYNTGVWIDATANYGYHFTQWNDGNTSAHRRIIVTEDTILTAMFAPNQYTATFATDNSVMGSVSTVGGSYEYLTTLTVTATPNYGYHFTQWNDG
ncbi:MAG: leucine-rich repeat protein, partial [Bacteroidales bacterium]|nr:leucine-rich repeat protein [Bacteroidales bacterium]